MRLYFLKKCKSPLIVYYAFILTKIKKFCFKRKIKIEKKKHKNFFKSKKIYHDFFSYHA